MALRSKSIRHTAASGAHRITASSKNEELSDVKCALATEVAQTTSRAAEHATALESIGTRAFEAAGVLSRDPSRVELLRKSHEVRGLVAHALAVLVDLQFQ